MGINVASSFTRNAPVPIDDSLVVADTTARDAIASGVRYEGMFCYVIADGANYQLVGGIANGNWEDFGSGGGGGGGGSLEFKFLDGFDAPQESTLGLVETYNFSEVGGQYLFLNLKVPSGYKAGDQIKLKGGYIAVNSTDTSKDILLVAKTQAVTPGDPFPSAISGGHNSVNTEVAPIANANFAIQTSDIDLCDGSGEVNGTPVVGGETQLIISLYRDVSNETDPYLGDVQLIKNSFYLSLKD